MNKIEHPQSPAERRIAALTEENERLLIENRRLENVIEKITMIIYANHDDEV